MNNKQSITTNMVTENGSYEKIGCHDAYVKISNKLKGRSIPQSFLRGLDSLRNAGNKYQVYKLTITAPDNADVLRQVIGRNGCYFIKTTQDCDLDFIWHNRDNNTIEFWGPQESIQKAHSVIKSRINKYVGITEMAGDIPLECVEDNVNQELDSLDANIQNGNMETENEGDDEVSKLSSSESGDQ